MSEINITNQSLPDRCEICHQSDCFDASNNHCSRCTNSVKGEINQGISLSPIATKINIYFELKFNDYVKAIFANLLRKPVAWIFLAILTVLQIYSLALFLASYDQNTSLTQVLAVILLPIITVIFLPLAIVISSKRILSTSKLAQKTARYTFTETGYEVSVEKSFSQHSWDSLWQAIETKDSFLFYTSSATFNLILKRAFNNPSEIDALKEILHNGLKDKAFLLGKKLPFTKRPAFCLTLYAVLLVIGTSFVGYNSYYHYKANQFNKVYSKGNALWQKHEYTEAETFYHQALVINPKSAVAYQAIGCGKVSLKDYESAEKYFHKALELDPNLVGGIEGLASTAYLLSDYTNAIKYYAQCLKLDPNSTEYNFYLAKSYSATGNTSLAREYYQRVVNLSPDSKRGKQAKLYLDEASSGNEEDR